MPILMHGGGASLPPLSYPAAAGDIVAGLEAYTDQGIKISGTLDAPSLNSLSVSFINQSTGERNITMTCAVEGAHPISVPSGEQYDVYEVDLAQPITVAEKSGVSLRYENFTLLITLT